MKIEFSEKKWPVFYLIIILWIVGASALGYIAWTSQPPSSSSKLIETLKIIFLLIGGLGVVLPTYLTYANAAEERKLKKIENTFELIERWDNPLLFDARKLLRELKEETPNLSDKTLIQKINGDDKRRQSVILVLNYFDGVRFSIKTRRVDLNLLKESIGTVFYDIHRRFLPYVETLDSDFKRQWEELYKLLK